MPLIESFVANKLPVISLLVSINKKFVRKKGRGKQVIAQ